MQYFLDLEWYEMEYLNYTEDRDPQFTLETFFSTFYQELTARQDVKTCRL